MFAILQRICPPTILADEIAVLFTSGPAFPRRVLYQYVPLLQPPVTTAPWPTASQYGHFATIGWLSQKLKRGGSTAPGEGGAIRRPS